MYKFIGAIAVLVLFSASQVSALTVTDIQAQIRELLAKVESLQVELKRLTNTSEVSPVGPVLTPPRDTGYCYAWTRSLTRGVQGADVSALQAFLQSEGYFSGSATGYFGPRTAEAVAKWQGSEGIVAVGTVGPQTRERMMKRCGQSSEYPFSASPERGSAPLTVAFSTWISGFRTQNPSYEIDFGDGSSEQVVGCNAPADACISAGINTHAYTTDGVYTAILQKVTNPCEGILYCKAALQKESLAKIVITVGAVGCSKEYMPVCGSYQVQCITTPCNPVEQTYGNKCLMNQAGAQYVHAGVCTVPGNQPPEVREFSAPTNLSVNEQGTWSIAASDPENGTLSYRIDWGDSYIPAAVSSALRMESASFTQQTSFTHTYTAAGTYTVKVYVKDDAGTTATASATVRVGAPVACTLQYQPVCGQPPEPACRNSVPACMMATPGPRTYGNTCQLNAEGAQYLYEGECRTEYPVACTMDARQCPDGSWVGRSGPSCQFVCSGTLVN